MQLRRSARLIIVDAEERLLLFRYHDEHRSPFWATVGGELLPGESYRDAAQRELREETGLDVPIGALLRERNAVYAVARSSPARWLEQYFLVRCPACAEVVSDSWTEEERSTIQAWRWWPLAEMRAQPASAFKPEWLVSLFESVLADGSGAAC